MGLSRQINKATRAKIARNSYSIKTGSMQFIESMTENDVCLSMDFNPEVKAYSTQPDSFHNETNRGGWRRYTPDVLIEYENNYDFAEVKPEDLTQSDSFKQKYALHQKVVREHSGQELKLLTEPQVHPRTLTQWRQLKAYYRFDALPEVNQEVLQFLSNNSNTARLSDIDKICQKHNAPDFYPMVMLAHQVIRCVHPEVITRETLVEIA